MSRIFIILTCFSLPRTFCEVWYFPLNWKMWNITYIVPPTSVLKWDTSKVQFCWGRRVIPELCFRPSAWFSSRTKRCKLYLKISPPSLIFFFFLTSESQLGISTSSKVLEFTLRILQFRFSRVAYYQKNALWNMYKAHKHFTLKQYKPVFFSIRIPECWWYRFW